MSFWDTIKHTICEWSNVQEEKYKQKHSKYEPLYKGTWVNKGSLMDEDWTWVEEEDKIKHLRPYYVMVFIVNNNFLITLGVNIKEDAEIWIECYDNKDIELAVTFLKKYYEPQGNVTVDKKLLRGNL